MVIGGGRKSSRLQRPRRLDQGGEEEYRQDKPTASELEFEYLST
jgi:hypothetical protein